MKRFNIVTAKIYEKDGKQKKAWKNVGQLFMWEATQNKPESFQMELNMFPNEKFYVFNAKPKNEQQGNDEL